MKECHEQIGLAVMGAVKSCSKKRDGAVAAIAAAHRSVDGGVVTAMGKGKGGGSKLSITSYAISDTFLPFRIALVSLILFLGVAAFLFSRGSVSFLSLAPAALLEKMDRIHDYEYEIVHEFPHDPTAFTQGLVYNGNETFYESTGLYGKSSVRKVDVTTGKVMCLYLSKLALTRW